MVVEPAENAAVPTLVAVRPRALVICSEFEPSRTKDPKSVATAVENEPVDWALKVKVTMSVPTAALTKLAASPETTLNMFV